MSGQQMTSRQRQWADIPAPDDKEFMTTFTRRVDSTAGGGVPQNQSQINGFSEDDCAYNNKQLGDGPHPVCVPSNGYVQELLKSHTPGWDKNTRFIRYHGHDERPCTSRGAANDFCKIVRESIENNPTFDNPSATYYPTKNGAATGCCITLDLGVKRRLPNTSVYTPPVSNTHGSQTAERWLRRRAPHVAGYSGPVAESSQMALTRQPQYDQTRPTTLNPPYPDQSQLMQNPPYGFTSGPQPPGQLSYGQTARYPPSHGESVYQTPSSGQAAYQPPPYGQTAYVRQSRQETAMPNRLPVLPTQYEQNYGSVFNLENTGNTLPGLDGIDPKVAQYELQISFLLGQARSNYLCLPTHKDRKVDWVNSGGVYRVTSVPTAAAYQKSLIGSGVDITHCAEGLFEGVKTRLDQARYSHPNDPKGTEVKLFQFIPDGSGKGWNVNYQASVTERRRK